MKKWTILLSLVVVFALLLGACTAPAGEDGIGTPGSETFVPSEPGGVDQPMRTQQLATPTLMSPETMAPVETGTPEPGGTQPVGSGAVVIPATGGQSLNLLSTLLGYQVIDRDGALIGTVNDFIVNMCEAHVLYILVDVDPALQAEAMQTLVPYELVTLQNGTINGAEQTIQVNIRTTDLNNVPAYDRNRVILTDGAWETEVTSFWSAYMTQSLTTECSVPAIQPGEAAGVTSTAVVTGTAVIPGTPGAPEITPTVPGTVTIPVQPTQTPSTDSTGSGTQDNMVSVTTLILGSALLQVEVEDGTGQSVGLVVDAVVVPETGFIRYVAVRLNQAEAAQADGELVLIPVRAVNMRYEGQNDFNPRLVLLVEAEILLNAPTIAALNDIEAGGFSADAFNYWSQYVPLTEEEQPQP